jgi:hypothetical protein
MGRLLERRRLRRLVGARGRSALAAELRRAASERARLEPRSGKSVAELSALAALVQETADPPARWIAAVHELARDRHSPLRGRLAHESEVLAELYYLMRPWLPRWREQDVTAPGAGGHSAPTASRRDSQEVVVRGQDPRQPGIGFYPSGRGRSA